MAKVQRLIGIRAGELHHSLGSLLLLASSIAFTLIHNFPVYGRGKG